MARGDIAKEELIPGASVQKGTPIVKPFLLFLLNCVENHRHSEKCETNFVGSVVNYYTTFVILS
jgi:hypothetical protein